MTATLTPLAPRIVADRLKAGSAVLVDIRDADEFARRRIAGALSRPLAQFEEAHLKIEPEKDVVFTCRTGMRTNANCGRLAAQVDGEAYVLDGGVDAWAAAGLPVLADSKAPLEMFRQVQLGAGALVLLGVVLSLLIHPGFIAVPGLVGAGLIFAGASGFCGMAKVLALAPWNRPRAA